MKERDEQIELIVSKVADENSELEDKIEAKYKIKI